MDAGYLRASFAVEDAMRIRQKSVEMRKKCAEARQSAQHAVEASKRIREEAACKAHGEVIHR